MRSRMFLLILPILDLVGLMSLQVGLFAKFGLWSLSVMNASLSAVVSTLSSILSFVAMASQFCRDDPVRNIQASKQPLPQ